MDIEWISISDFSPGIFGDYHGGIATSSRGATLINGAASIAGTFGCCSDAAGSLVPLPAGTSGKTQLITQITATITTPTFYPTNNQAIYILDALVATRFTDTTTLPTGTADSESVAVAYGFMYSNAGGGVGTYEQNFIGRLYRNWKPGSNQDFFFGKGNLTPPAGTLPHFVLSWTRHLRAAATAPDYHIAWIARPSHFQETWRTGAMAAADQALTTFDTDTTNGPNYLGATSSAWSWPAALNPAANTTEALHPAASTTRYNNLIGHQGRLVHDGRDGTGFGNATDIWAGDQVSYTPVNTLGAAALFATYGEENVHGNGIMASLSADELLIIKNHGGGYMIRGDLSNPTVVKLPFIESTYGVQITPTITPMGLVYATRNGIFSFAGGDTTKKLSTQIEGFFFQHELDPTNEKYVGNRGRMEWWHPWVMVPNDFMLDTRTGGWWRLEDASVSTYIPHNIFQVVPTSGKLYAFPYKIMQTLNTVYHVYDPAVLTNTYQWQSQPLVETRDRLRSFQTVRIIAAPGPHNSLNTVLVTLRGVAEDGTQQFSQSVSLTFTAPDLTGRPVVLEAQITPNFVAMWTQVKVTATATSGAAPKIMQLDIGTTDRSLRKRITT